MGGSFRPASRNGMTSATPAGARGEAGWVCSAGVRSRRRHRRCRRRRFLGSISLATRRGHQDPPSVFGLITRRSRVRIPPPLLITRRSRVRIPPAASRESLETWLARLAPAHGPVDTEGHLRGLAAGRLRFIQRSEEASAVLTEPAAGRQAAGCKGVFCSPVTDEIPGLRDELVTLRLARRLTGMREELAELAQLDVADAPERFGRHAGEAIRRALEDMQDADDRSTPKLSRSTG